MPFIHGHYTDRGGRPVSGSITLSPVNGDPIRIRVVSSVLDRTAVPAGVYDVAAHLESNASPAPLEYAPATVTIPATPGPINLTNVPPLARPVLAPRLTVNETAPGVYEVIEL